MADVFAPKLSSDVRFNEPVEQPSIVGTLAKLGEGFLSALPSGGSGGGKPKTDPNLAAFSEGVQRIQAVRDQKGELAAQIEERKLATNFAAAGINFDADYQAVYEKTTGRAWAGYGMDYESRTIQDTLAKPEVQALYISSFAVNKDWTEAERIDYAISQQANLSFYNNEIAQSKANADYKWTTQSEAAYVGTIDTFLNTNLGALVATSKQGGRVGPQALANLSAQWGQLKVNLSRPANVSDDQWKSVQDKMSNIDAMLTNMSKAASSDVMFEEMTTALATSLAKGGTPEDIIAAMVAVKDPSTLATLQGVDTTGAFMKAKGSLNFNFATPDLFGHIVEDQGGVGGSTDPNAILTTLPADVEAKIKGKTPEQIFNGLEASGLLTSLVRPNTIQGQDARNQFVENAVTIGAVMKGTDNTQFLSNDMLKKLVANHGFISNVKALDAIDPEAASVTRTYVRTGLDTERAKQEANLGAIDSQLSSKGIVWDGNDYVLTPEAASKVTVYPGLGGMGGVVFNELNVNAEAIRQAKDRRAAIGTIDGAMTALEVPVDKAVAQTGVGSVTSSLLDKHEGGGDYNALLGFANRQGGPFGNINVSQMTIGQLKDFANGAYADYSTKQLGYKATPMGRFQFVGSTLASVAKKMGLDDNTVFTPEVQNQMFIFHAKEVMAGKNEAGKRGALRSTWAGLRNASDADLNKMIAEIEGGTVTFGAGGTGGAFTGATPANANALASAAGAATQRAVDQQAAPQQATGSVAVNTGTAQATAMDIAAAMPEQIATPAQGGQQGQPAPVAVNKDVQNAIKELSAQPDATYNTDAEFLAAQQRGELSPGDTVVVNGDLYIIRKDGSAKRIGNVNAQ